MNENIHCGRSAEINGVNGVMERKDSMQALGSGGLGGLGANLGTNLGANLGLGVLGLIERDQRARVRRGEGGFWGPE
jgi:glucokinase